MFRIGVEESAKAASKIIPVNEPSAIIQPMNKYQRPIIKFGQKHLARLVKTDTKAGNNPNPTSGNTSNMPSNQDPWLDPTPKDTTRINRIAIDEATPSQQMYFLVLPLLLIEMTLLCQKIESLKKMLR